MNPSGWIVLTASVGSVVSLLVFCLFRVLTMPPAVDDDSDLERV